MRLSINEGAKQRRVELNENMDDWGTLRQIRTDEIESFWVNVF